MIISTNAIVLRRFNYQETSIIAEILTESDGLISTIAKGARQNKKSLGILEPLNIIFVSFYKKSTKDLFLLSKYETISSFYKLMSSFERLIYGLMITESIYKTQISGIANPKLFHRTLETIENLKSSENNPFLLFVQFMLFLVADLGFEISLTKDKLSISNEKKIPFDLSKGTISTSSKGENIFWLSKNATNLLSELHIIEKFASRHYNSKIEKEIIYFFESYLTLHLEKTFNFQSFSFLNQ
ncbi:MAG: DNA repair protein RecO [Candidatus Kapaibacteriales bacterium]